MEKALLGREIDL